MSIEKQDFYGKEVSEAIRKACEELGVAQERLNIEVIETGSSGIFGLIRKKAHIRVQVQEESEGESEEIFEVNSLVTNEKSKKPKRPAKPPQDKKDHKKAPSVKQRVKNDEAKSVEIPQEDLPVIDQEMVTTITPESAEIIKKELLEIVDLMGFPSTSDIEIKGSSLHLTLQGDYEENLAGQGGKVLDSLQYLLRKIASRKVDDNLRLHINYGDFRERRLEELKARALELASLVKENGKTQVISALNPSERRSVHMILQEDKEIRSRSVGEGMFKKILIYKPGKGNRSGGKRRGGGKGGSKYHSKKNQNKSRPKKVQDS